MALVTGPWPARVTWALLPLTTGPSLGDALDDRSRSTMLTGSLLAWSAWSLVLVAVLVPRTASLTALRIAAPAALGVAMWAALDGERVATDAASVGWAALTLVAALAPTTGDCFVNGSSYGDERRMPLRVPGMLLLGPIQLAWIAAVGGPVGAPLLLASRQWEAGAALALLGTPAAAVATRALHSLSRRWVVLVPAGLVLHDLHALIDPILFPRAQIRRLGPAPADGDGARDLTQRSLGLALEIELAQPVDIVPRRPDRTVSAEPVERLLFAPTRPGAVMREASKRHISVG
ncbi:MAG: hypothetical protein ACOYXM_14140 [Actinomycetota bacterium]